MFTYEIKALWPWLLAAGVGAGIALSQAAGDGAGMFLLPFAGAATIIVLVMLVGKRR